MRPPNRTVGASLALLATLFVLAACGSSVKPRAAFPGTWIRRQDVALSVPRGFRQYPVSGPGPSASAAGVLLADYAVKGGIRGAFYKWSDSKAPPPGRTAVQVEEWSGFGPAAPFTRLHLPLSLDQPWTLAHGTNGHNGYRYGAFVLHGQIYKVFVWDGPSAPWHDRNALVRALASIRDAT